MITLLSLSLQAWSLEQPQAQQYTAPLNLMPYPQQLERQSGEWQLNADAVLMLSSPDHPVLNAALERFRERFQRQAHIALTLAREGNHPQQLVVELTKPPSERELQLPITLEALSREREAYRLTIDAHTIHLQAQAYPGIQHGLETFLQLLPNRPRADTESWIALPQLTIHDGPRFRWRGLMLDSVRHFFSVETIKRQLDAMAAAKLNIFHWHLTDDQGWRMESREYPKLHEKASDGFYYTQDEIRDVVAYAMARGIQVVPEIDLPGHSSAIAVAYPELMSAPGPYRMEKRWGVHRPLLNPANPAVYQFAEKIFEEVAELFPFAYVHIGGDEVDPRDWLENADIRAFMTQNKLATAEDLHAYFNQHMARILTRLERRMIGWDEIFHPDLPKGTVVQSWQGPDALGKVANRGYPTLLSTGFYLDQPQATAYHYRNAILPTPLAVDDQPGANESWNTWRFELPRKRGRAISGQFTVIEHPDDGPRGFIDFEGKSRQAVHNLSVRRGITYFQVDTWMGPVLARLQFQDNLLSGDMVVGNAPYPASGTRVAGSDLPGTRIPEAITPPVIAPDQLHQVLGGEAALWSEIVDERHIDLRLWPRTFAVAERLWSSADMTDEAFMYQRLLAISDWAEQSLNLQHNTQASEALSKLVPVHQLEPVRMLSKAVEPAHYYHRHHEKSVYGSYSRDDPLDWFVDTLPVESHPVRKLDEQLQRWRQTPDDKVLAEEVRTTLTAWRDNASHLLNLLDQDGDPAELRAITEQVQTTTQWGLVLIELINNQTGLSESIMRAARRQLRTAQSIHSEVVVAVAYPIERLLDEVLLNNEL